MTAEAHEPHFEIEGPILRIAVENGEVSLRLALVHSVQLKHKRFMPDESPNTHHFWSVLVDGYIVQHGTNEDASRTVYDSLNAAVFGGAHV